MTGLDFCNAAETSIGYVRYGMGRHCSRGEGRWLDAEDVRGGDQAAEGTHCSRLPLSLEHVGVEAGSYRLVMEIVL